MQWLLFCNQSVFLLSDEGLKSININGAFTVEDKVSDLILLKGAIWRRLAMLIIKVEKALLKEPFISFLGEKVDVEKGSLTNFIITIA